MYFKQISTVLPDTRLNIMDEYKSLGLEKYEAQVHTVIYGIKEIRVLPDTEDFIDFIARPLRNLIRNGVESSSIKFVIYCHTAPWVMPPWQQTELLSEVSKYFPQFSKDDFKDIEPWAGLRPCSPDGLPYIGRTKKFSNLLVATGHAMLGVSLGPVTGKLISQMVTDEPVEMDMTLLDVDRYN